MRIVSLNELKPEMELAREIMDPDNGRVLLNVGAVGLSQYAERLRGSARQLLRQMPADRLVSPYDMSAREILGEIQG